MKDTSDTHFKPSAGASALPEVLYNSSVSATTAEEAGETAAADGFRDAARDGLVCPNCGGPLEGRKCKLFCHTPGCGYLVTCSEW